MFEACAAFVWCLKDHFYFDLQAFSHAYRIKIIRVLVIVIGQSPDHSEPLESSN